MTMPSQAIAADITERKTAGCLPLIRLSVFEEGNRSDSGK